LPALLVFALWAAAQPNLVVNWVVAGLPPELRDLPPDRLNLVINDLKNLVGGNFVASASDPVMVEAAERYRRLQAIGNAALWVVVLSLAIAGIAYAWRAISPALRARNRVEGVTATGSRA